METNKLQEVIKKERIKHNFNNTINILIDKYDEEVLEFRNEVKYTGVYDE